MAVYFVLGPIKKQYPSKQFLVISWNIILHKESVQHHEMQVLNAISACPTTTKKKRKKIKQFALDSLPDDTNSSSNAFVITDKNQQSFQCPRDDDV